MSIVKKTYEGYGRMGRDWANGIPFFGESPSRQDFAYIILESLGEKGNSKEIHDLTTGIIDLDTRSITGDFYLTEKCIKYKINVSVEAELVDDRSPAGD